jgi:hypothetical protein
VAPPASAQWRDVVTVGGSARSPQRGRLQGLCLAVQPSLQIAVTNHIDVIGGAHNDGITWRAEMNRSPGPDSN